MGVGDHGVGIRKNYNLSLSMSNVVMIPLPGGGAGRAWSAASPKAVEHM